MECIPYFLFLVKALVNLIAAGAISLINPKPFLPQLEPCLLLTEVASAQALNLGATMVNIRLL